MVAPILVMLTAIASKTAVILLTLWLVRNTGERLVWWVCAIGTITLLSHGEINALAGMHIFSANVTTLVLSLLAGIGLFLLVAGWLLLVPLIKKHLSDRRHRKEELLQLKQVTDTLPLLLIFIDTKQKVIYMNATSRLWFNTSEDLAIGNHLKYVVGTGFYSVLEAQIEHALTGEETTYANVPIDQGDRRHYSVSYLPERSNTGEVLGLHIVIEDITDQHRAEEKLRDVELKMAELSTIRKTAATYEHEINSPLTGILSIASFLKDDSMPEEERNELIKDLIVAAKRIQHVTAQISKLNQPNYRDYPTGKTEILKVE